LRPPCLTDKDDFICVGNTRTEGLTTYDYGDPFARQAAAHILEDGDGSESDDQDFDDERVQYAPRPSQGRKSLPVRFITKPFLVHMPSFWWRSASQSVRPRIKDSMLTAGLRMRDSAQLQLY